MIDNTTIAFSFPAVEAKKITAAFDGGASPPTAASCCWHWPSGVSGSPGGLQASFQTPAIKRASRTFADMIRARIFAICYEDADDLNFLRTDPFKTRLRPSARHGSRPVFAADAVAP